MDHKKLYNKLIQKIKLYHPSNDYSMVEKAYLLAYNAHGDQMRRSGEPYIIHPLSVALLLVDLELDLESIASGILHDVIEDTKYSYEDIKKLFGKEVADIVDGVTKFNKFQYKNKEEQKAETYRKMFLAMAKDIRVILIKIADRLHNMRTLEHMPEYKQKEIAQETLDIYAPIAGRLGISKIKNDLEDLSFMYLHPKEYEELKRKIEAKQIERKTYVDIICVELEKALINNDINGTVQGRPKHYFSIYRKMKSQELTFDEIYDLFAFRVIVLDIQTCYTVVGIVHEMYTPVHGRFKDYIAAKKENYYRSIHTTLIGPGSEPFEIQIRTWEMHKAAEYGIAAHWKYKQNVDGKTTTENEEQKMVWLRQILEMQQYEHDNAEFVDALKKDLDIFEDIVYTFTPQGEPISLKKGSTPLDFAYKIHTAVGNQAVGARVDGKMVPFDYVLKNGNIVEIHTSRNSAGPSRDWLKLVKTSQAKTKINQWFKKQNKGENIIKGKEALEKEAKKYNITLAKLLADGREKKLLARFSYGDWDTLLSSIGIGSLKETYVLKRLLNDYENRDEKYLTSEEIIKRQELSLQKIKKEAKKKENETKKDIEGISIKGIGNFSELRLSKCCTPIPGDEIIGFVTRGRGISIHRTDCINILNLPGLERQRLIETWWTMPEQSSSNFTYTAEIKVIGKYSATIFTDVMTLINKETKMMGLRLNRKTEKDKNNNDIDKAYMSFTITVSSKNEIEALAEKIHKIGGIIEVERPTT